MAIKPKCDVCMIEFTDFGALLFSPPDENNMAKKYHICQACFSSKLEKLVNQDNSQDS